MENRDVLNQPPSNLPMRDRFAAWINMHLPAFLVGLAVAAIAWSTASYFAERGDVPLPSGATQVHITDYSPAYGVYRDKQTLILHRERGSFQSGLIAWFAFFTTFMVVRLIAEFREDRHSSTFSWIVWIAIAGTLGPLYGWVLYGYVYPSVVVIENPQTFVFDPIHDQVVLNEKFLGKMSAIAEFVDVEKESNQRGGSYEWTWFGVRLKDGRYYPFTTGIYTGGNLGPVAEYLNQYLKETSVSADSTH